MPTTTKRRQNTYKVPSKKRFKGEQALVKAKSTYVPKRVPRGIQPMVDIGKGFPRMMKVQLHYVDNFYLKTATAGTTFTYNYILNGLYDSDSTGVGHQPFYFDQLIALYNHYTVIGSKVAVTWTNSADKPCIVGGYIQDDSTVAVSGISTFQEQATSQYRMLPAATSEQPPTTIVHKWSAKDHFTGNKDSILSDTNLSGTSGANPVEQSCLTLFAQSMDTVTGATTVNFSVRGEFIVVFWELREQSQS